MRFSFGGLPLDSEFLGDVVVGPDDGTIDLVPEFLHVRLVSDAVAQDVGEQRNVEVILFCALAEYEVDVTDLDIQLLRPLGTMLKGWFDRVDGTRYFQDVHITRCVEDDPALE